MDEDDNSPHYHNKILGPEESLHYIQSRLQKIEESRNLGIETVNRRKVEIFERARNNEATLARIEKSQHTLEIVKKFVTIGAVSLAILEIAKGGARLIEYLVKRWKSQSKQSESRNKVKELSDAPEDVKGLTMEQRTNAGKLRKTRLHARHWQAWEFLE
jgi:hypothetical protein